MLFSGRFTKNNASPTSRTENRNLKYISLNVAYHAMLLTNSLTEPSAKGFLMFSGGIDKQNQAVMG